MRLQDHRIWILALGLSVASWAVAAEDCKLPETLGLATHSTGKLGSRTSGSGQAVDDIRPVSGFHAVKVHGPLAVELRAADRERVTVRIDDNLQAMIRVEVQDGTLEVGPAKDAGFTTRTPPTVIVEYLALDSISLAGSGDIVGSNVRPPKGLRAAIAGSGDICLSGLKTVKLAVSVAGSGDVRVQGAADEVSIRIAGSGDAHADALEGKRVKVSIAGSGDPRVHALDELEVSVAGSGDVRYRGYPKVTRRVAGSGSVKPL